MAVKDEFGRWGEQLAADHLRDKGLVVLSRNWRCPEGEIDIIATDGIGRLIVCEVKTRRGVGFGTPAEAITVGKRRKLRRLAQVYLAAEHHVWMAIRFDVIAVLAEPGQRPQVTHLEAAF